MKANPICCALLLIFSACLLLLNAAQASDDPPSRKQEKNESKYPAATAEQQARTINHLKMLMLATYNYADDYRHMPTDIVDKDNKPLLSWRVSLLPYLEHAELYYKFKLNEPWDSEHNKALLKEMPRVFLCQRESPGQTKTYMQVFKGPGAFMEPGKKLRVPDFGDTPRAKVEGVKIDLETITDTLSQTFGIVEAGPPVPWTKPEDIVYHPNKPLPALDGPYGFAMQVGFADGTAQTIHTRVPEHLMRRMIERNDGKTIAPKDWEMIQAKPAPPENLKDYYDNQSKDVEAKKPLPSLKEELEKETSKRQNEYQAQLVQLVSLLQEEARLRDNLTEQAAKQAVIEWGLRTEDMNDAIVLHSQLIEKLKAYPVKKEKTGSKPNVSSHKPTQMNWEYKFVMLSVSSIEKDEKLLNQLGNDGWELVTAPTRNPALLMCIFKRAKR